MLQALVSRQIADGDRPLACCPSRIGSASLKSPVDKPLRYSTGNTSATFGQRPHVRRQDPTAEPLPESLAGQLEEAGRRQVVRNGRARARKITLGCGTVQVAAPRINDKRLDEQGRGWPLPRGPVSQDLGGPSAPSSSEGS